MKIKMGNGKKQVVVAVDIGNTVISFGVWKRGRFVKTGFLNRASFGQNQFHKKFKKLPDEVVFVICSVVPKTTKQFAALVKLCAPFAKVYVVGRNIQVAIPAKYNRRKLGLDRLVNVYGAVMRYQLPALVIDFGTAITFDYVSEKGVFEGGVIVPGIETSLKALLKRAALIPDVFSLRPVRSLVGHETRSALASGMLNGFGALADGLIERFKSRFGGRMTVVATGGHSKLIAPYSRLIQYVDPLHTLKSLVSVYLNELR